LEKLKRFKIIIGTIRTSQHHDKIEDQNKI